MMTRKESMIKVLRYKAENIKTKIKPEFFNEVADVLEQEPCEDAISRAEAVKVASGYCHPANIAKELEKLPPVAPKAECSCEQIKWERDMAIAQLNELGYGLGEKPRTGRWIPVSEGTPKHGGEYLLWGKICADDEEDYCFIGDYYEFEEKFGIETSNYDPHTLGFLDTEIDEYYSVKAWMPLPKPPQESELKNEKP